MRLTCPSCASVYEVSPILMAGRRAVRCAHCGHVWAYSEAHGGPPILDMSHGEPEQVEPRISAITPVEDPGEPKRRAQRTGLWAAWIATTLILALALWAVIAYRNNVMRAWPPSIRAYAAFGMSPARLAPR